MQKEKNMSKTFYFHVSSVRDELSEQIGINPYYICIVAENYWNKNKCLDDRGIYEYVVEHMGENALENIYEETESMFSTTLQLTRDQLITEMLNRGFKQNNDFSKYLEEN
jgi:hypothetical protein